MADFSGEPIVTTAIKSVQAAAKSTKLDTGVALTDGDILLFTYFDKDKTAHAIVATDSDTLAIRT